MQRFVEVIRGDSIFIPLINHLRHISFQEINVKLERVQLGQFHECIDAFLMKLFGLKKLMNRQLPFKPDDKDSPPQANGTIMLAELFLNHLVEEVEVAFYQVPELHIAIL